MASQYQHKLFLWIEGYFPKRIVYYLLSHGLCSSVDQLYAGDTNEPNLHIVRIVFNGEGFVSEDPTTPFPTETTVPALRLDDTITGKSIWIRETWSIINYLEEAFPRNNVNHYRQMWADDPIEKAIAWDVIGNVLSASEQGGVWLDNCAPFMVAFRQIPDEEHSIGVGRRARRGFEDHFKMAQEVAANNLAKTGWLTPAADGGPGMGDVNLAAMVRHTEEAWSVFVLENDALEPLRRWYKNFQNVWYWHELEETGRFPDSLKRGEDFAPLGYKYLALQMPPIGHGTNGVVWEADREKAFSTATPYFEQAKEVILVGNSYGGVPTTVANEGQGVADRAKRGLPGGFHSVIFLAAFAVPTRGWDVLTTFGGTWPEWFDTGKPYIKISCTWVLTVLQQLLYNNTTKKEAKETFCKLSPHSQV